MILKTLDRTTLAFIPTEKSIKKLDTFDKLIAALQHSEIPDNVAESINREVDSVNEAAAGTEEQLLKQVAKAQRNILNIASKELKLVPKNFYRLLWTSLGMAAFGIPIGVAFGASVGNMGLMAVGLPIGLAIGIAVGTVLDKKAKEEGKQLDLDI